MATIDDIHAVERLMQTLDENPHLMEAVRSRMLTRELLELPQTMARLTERVDQIAEQLAQLTERVDQLTERVDRLTERVDQIAEQLAQLTERVDRLTERVDQLAERVDRLTERVDQIAEQLAQLTERVDQLTERVDQLTERVDGLAERMDRRFDRIENDIGEFRDAAAINSVLKNAAAIVASLGLVRTRELVQDELIAMARDHDTTDIARNDLQSFYLADLIVQATDDQAETHYVAVEASYTADARDTRRAIRNADYLTRFTGYPAQAMVVARRTDWEIDEQIASGAVHLFRLPERRSRGS